MLLETTTIKFPDKDTVPFEIKSAYVDALRARFMESGKLIQESVVKHPNGMVRVIGRLFRDAEARQEWWADPIVLARSVLAREHNGRNNITVTSNWVSL